MSMLKLVLVYGGAGLAVSVVAQVGYVLCLFSEHLAKVLLVPLLYVAFWPVFLVDLFKRGGLTGPEAHPLGVSCLLSFAGWLAAGVALALLQTLLHRGPSH